jgi:hypothetical protein
MLVFKRLPLSAFFTSLIRTGTLLVVALLIRLAATGFNVTAAAGGFFTEVPSSTVPNSPHERHLPDHRGCSLPHFEQMKTFLAIIIFSSFY